MVAIPRKITINALNLEPVKETVDILNRLLKMNVFLWKSGMSM
ncbi:hypothetical protein [Paenibacillus sp. FSL R10-2734]